MTLYEKINGRPEDSDFGLIGTCITSIGKSGRSMFLHYDYKIGKDDFDAILLTLVSEFFSDQSKAFLANRKSPKLFQAFYGGRGRIRTDERTKRADLQSASFSHLDTLPERIVIN